MVKASMQRDPNEHEWYRLYLEVEAARVPVHNRCSVNVYGKIVFIKCLLWTRHLGIPWWLSSKESACIAGVPSNKNSIPGWGRFPGGGNGNPLHCSCKENPMDGGAGWATVHEVAKSWTRLSDTHIYTRTRHEQVLR